MRYLNGLGALLIFHGDLLAQQAGGRPALPRVGYDPAANNVGITRIN